MLAKKTYIRFALNIPLSSHAMHQLAKEGYLNAKDNSMAILRRGEQLVAMVDCLE